MRYHRYNISKHCRWCGKSYLAVRPVGKDGFCCQAHKQAHYRAYKNYVTARRAAAGSQANVAVTQKTRKKKGKRNVKIKKNR